MRVPINSTSSVEGMMDTIWTIGFRLRLNYPKSRRRPKQFLRAEWKEAGPRLHVNKLRLVPPKIVSEFIEPTLQDFVTDLGFIAADRLDVLLVAGSKLIDNTALRSGRSHSSLRKISNGEFRRKSELAGTLQRSRFGDRP